MLFYSIFANSLRLHQGHCVTVFSKEGQFLRRIGSESVTNYPNGIDVSGHGDVLIGDRHGNRFHVGVFQRDGTFMREFQVSS